MAVCYNNKAIALTKKENTDSDTSKCQMVTTVFVLPFLYINKILLLVKYFKIFLF